MEGISKNRLIIYSVILSVSISFMFFISAPLEMYFGNIDEVFYDCWIVLKPMILLFIVFALIGVAILSILQKHSVYPIVYCLLFIAFISTYIWGTYFSNWLPKLDGSTIDWNYYSKYRLICIFIWLIVTIVVYALYRIIPLEKYIKYLSGIALFVCLILLSNIVFLGISSDGFKTKEIYADTSTTKNMFAYSENKNMLVLVLDKTDAAVMKEFLEENPDYTSIFQDFTFFTNMESAFPYTLHSVPMMLTGVPYEKQLPYSEYLNSVYEGSELFSELERNDYSIGIYETLFKMKTNGKRFDNLVKCEHTVSSWPTFVRWQIALVGYKYAPFDLKRFCYLYTTAFDKLKVISGDYMVFSDYNEDFWEELCNQESNRINNNNFRFIHIYGAHDPWISTEGMIPVENGTYEDGIKASLTITEKYLNRYKEVGAYDNAAIIIMADHGYTTGFQENPIFFVKGINEHHEMVSDDAPLSFYDLMDAYKGLLDGKKSDELFKWKNGDYRERKLLFQDDDDNPEEIMVEYVQTGHAGDSDTLIKLREF